MSGGQHLSIGEVLSLLQDEFPDITISKIRFLESQGLLDPERTPSGYRKFYEQDLRRLRWILTQQRDHFLPLKVIKDRLDSGFQPEPADDGPAEHAGDGNARPAPEDDRAAVAGERSSAGGGMARGNGTPAAESPVAAADDAVHVLSTGPGAGGERRERHAAGEPAVAAQPLSPTSARESRFGGRGEPSGGREERAGREERGGRFSAASWQARARGTDPRSSSPGEGGGLPESVQPPEDISSVSLSITELAGACGLEVDDVRELERFGLLCGQKIGPDVVYGDDALLAVQLAARFRRHGIEARHLRQYRMSADKEMALFEQVVAPFLRARDPGASRRALETLTQLADLGDSLRKVLVRRAMREYLGGE